jgi:hypothetical protein
MPPLKMGSKNEIKIALFDILQEKVEAKTIMIKNMIATIEESRNNETKSSVGDKYETGRAMMQIELDKANEQLLITQNLRHALNKIDIQKKCDNANLGCMIITTQGNYFLTIGQGKIEIENEKYFTISCDSPMGQLLLGKSVGESFSFRNMKIKITDIY